MFHQAYGNRRNNWIRISIKKVFRWKNAHKNFLFLLYFPTLSTFQYPFFNNHKLVMSHRIRTLFMISYLFSQFPSATYHIHMNIHTYICRGCGEYDEILIGSYIEDNNSFWKIFTHMTGIHNYFSWYFILLNISYFLQLVYTTYPKTVF